MNCSVDVQNEIERLKRNKVDGIILDLRNNVGGSLPDAQRMSGLFIPSGPIVQTKNYKSDIDVLKDEDSKTHYSGPLIVMTNRFSASASEILAGAMQDYKRAVIVGGQYTHGKGTVQAVIPLNSGIIQKMLGKELGALKVTIQKFYRVNGSSTQYKGITPDIIIPDPLAYVENREKDLEYSLPWDTVKEQTYTIWKEQKYNLETLRKRSHDRVKKSSRFQKIIKFVSYLTKKRNETLVSLNIKTVKESDKVGQEVSERLKITKENKEIKVSNFRESINKHEKIAKKDKKRWEKNLKEKEDEWIKMIRLDPGIEEAIYVMEDMIIQASGKRLSKVSLKEET